MTKTRIALTTFLTSLSLAGLSFLMQGDEFITQQTMALLTGSDTIVMNEAAVEKMLSEPVQPPLVPIEEEGKAKNISVKVLTTEGSDSKIILDDVKRDFPDGHILKLKADRPVDLSELMQKYLAARVSEYRNEIFDAASFYEEAEQADPQNMWLKEKAFAMQLRIGNVEQSISIAESLNGTKGVMPLVYLALLVEALNMDDLAKALELSEILIEKAPRVRDFAVIHAQLMLASGASLKNAIAAVGGLRLVNKSSVLSFTVGQWYQDAGDYKTAEKYYRRALVQYGQTRLYFLALINLYTETGQEEKRLETIAKLKEAYHGQLGYAQEFIDAGLLGERFENNLKNRIVDSLFSLSRDIEKANMGVPGLQVLNLALYLQPKNDWVLYEKGNYFNENERFEEAKTVFEQIEEGGLYYVRAQSMLVNILYALEQPTESLALIDKLIESYGYDDLLYQKAAILFRSERYKDALSIYQQFVENSEGQPAVLKARAYFSRGTAYERLGMIEKADEDLQKALSLQPFNASYLNFLGYMYVEQEIKMPDAHRLINAALKIAPRNAAILDSLGWYWYKEGSNNMLAISFLQKALVLTPDEWEIHEHLAEAYYKEGIVEEAVKSFNHAISFVTEEDEKHRLEKRLKSLKKAK